MERSRSRAKKFWSWWTSELLREVKRQAVILTECLAVQEVNMPCMGGRLHIEVNNENFICGSVVKSNCGVSLFCPQHVERPECQLHRQLGIHTFTSCVTQRTQVSCHFGLCSDWFRPVFHLFPGSCTFFCCFNCRFPRSLLCMHCVSTRAPIVHLRLLRNPLHSVD